MSFVKELDCDYDSCPECSCSSWDECANSCDCRYCMCGNE